MPRTGVTREQVFEAADALAQEGTQPTTRLVRDRTGGSFSTITPHLAAWKDERGKLAATLAEKEKRHRAAEERLGDLKIENARLEERIANTERRADELRNQVTCLERELARLAEQKGKEKESKEASTPKTKARPQESLMRGTTSCGSDCPYAKQSSCGQSPLPDLPEECGLWEKAPHMPPTTVPVTIATSRSNATPPFVTGRTQVTSAIPTSNPTSPPRASSLMKEKLMPSPSSREKEP
jgi:hypothetical protein